MICPKCKEYNQESIVYCHGGTSTLMHCTPFYDQKGIYHHHDNNTHRDAYSCSNGHRIIVKRIGKCPSCDFGKDSESIEITDSPALNVIENSGIVKLV